MKLEQVILRDTRANQPLATIVPIGSLFYVTDEQVIERSNGATWDSYSAPGSAVLDSTYLTETDETADLLNSRRLVAGSNITLDVATPGELAIIGGVSGIDELTGDVIAGPGFGPQVATLASKFKTEIIGITHNGNPMTTGIKGSFIIPWAATITKVFILANASGTLEFDILKTDYATFPAGGASIVAAAPPELATAQKYSDAVLTGWTTALAVDDILEYELTVIDAGITRVSLFLVLELN